MQSWHRPMLKVGISHIGIMAAQEQLVRLI